jgi:hypothetical protein
MGMTAKKFHCPQFWVKAPGAREAFGPVSGVRVAGLFAAGIVTESSWVSDGDTDFSPLSALPPDVLKVSSPADVSSPRVSRSEGAEPGEAPGENRFTGGYEVDEVLRFNRSLENEPDLNLPPIWREPRMKDKLRFTAMMMPLTAIFAYGLLLLKESGGMEYAPMATVAWLMGTALVWVVVFVLTPTRAGI